MWHGEASFPRLLTKYSRPQPEFCRERAAERLKKERQQEQEREQETEHVRQNAEAAILPLVV